MMEDYLDDYDEPYCERCGAESIESCECCPRCYGVGSIILLSGIEWNYVGSGYGTCPRCGGTGDL